MCEVKNFDEFFAKNLDIIVPSDSDNTPNSIRIKKSLFHYFIVGRDLPVEVIKDGRVIDMREKEIGKYIWGIERRLPGRYQLNVSNCLALAELDNLEKKFKIWRTHHMSALGNAIHELDFVNVVKAIDNTNVYDSNGELDFRSIRLMLLTNWEEANVKLLSKKLKISKKAETKLIEFGIESNNLKLIQYLVINGVVFDHTLFNGLKPLGYSILRGKREISNVFIKLGLSIFDIDNLGNSNGVYNVIGDGHYIDHSDCSIGFPFKLPSASSSKKVVLKTMPESAKWKDQECLNQFKSSAKRLELVIPDLPFKDIKGIVGYSDLVKIAGELDAKQDSRNEFKHNLTDEEFKWRYFVKQAYSIYNTQPKKFDSSYRLSDQELMQATVQHKNEARLRDSVFVLNPKNGKMFCKLDYFWEIISKFDKKVYFTGECPSWTGDESLYSKILKAGLAEDYAEQIADQILNGKNGEQLKTDFLNLPVVSDDNGLGVYQKLMHLMFRDKISNHKQAEDLLNIIVSKGITRHLYISYDNALFFNSYFTSLYNSNKWNAAIDHSVRMFVMTKLEVTSTVAIKSKQHLLSTDKINFLNGEEYYLCGRYITVTGFGRGKEEISLTLPHCLSNEESTDESQNGMTNLPSGRVYNVDEDLIAFGVDEVGYSQGSLADKSFYRRMQVASEKIDYSRFGKVVFFKRSEVISPSILSDGKITIGLPGLHVYSIKLYGRRYIISDGGPCSGNAVQPDLKILPVEVRGDLSRESIIDSKFYVLPDEFEAIKGKIINHLPLDQPYEGLCVAC